MGRVALIYHDVLSDEVPQSGRPGPAAARYKLPIERFAAHLDAIAAAGSAPMLVRDDGPDGVLLTFDDGGISAAATIGPLLEERGWRGHFFVVTDAIGSPGFAAAVELRRLHASGHVVGSHTHTHPQLTRQNDERVADEWRRSRTILEELLGAPVTTASVPYGFYADRIGRSAAEAGYVDVFTSEPWLRPRALGHMRLHGRFSVVATTSPQRVAALCRRSPVAIARASAEWYALKAVKTALGPAYLRARRAVLSRRAL